MNFKESDFNLEIDKISVYHGNIPSMNDAEVSWDVS